MSIIKRFLCWFGCRRQPDGLQASGARWQQIMDNTERIGLAEEALGKWVDEHLPPSQ